MTKALKELLKLIEQGVEYSVAHEIVIAKLKLKKVDADQLQLDYDNHN